ncbi:hypothetical protein ACFE04_001240 [Oxalis oulophora]
MGLSSVGQLDGCSMFGLTRTQGLTIWQYKRVEAPWSIMTLSCLIERDFMCLTEHDFVSLYERDSRLVIYFSGEFWNIPMIKFKKHWIDFDRHTPEFEKNDGADKNNHQTDLSIFNDRGGQFTSGAEFKELNIFEFKQAQFYVLKNCAEVQPWEEPYQQNEMECTNHLSASIDENLVIDLHRGDAEGSSVDEVILEQARPYSDYEDKEETNSSNDDSYDTKTSVQSDHNMDEVY